MIIGIDASRAFQNERTGIEEYSFQLIKSLRDKLDGQQVVLYISSTNYEFIQICECTNWIPKEWKIRVISWPKFWTQVGLSLEMLFRPVDVLFVPAHTVPFFHARKTVVTVHGLEYEIRPQDYSFWGRLYMRFFIRNSCRWAKKIIAVSENTKKDLMRLYNIPENKIEVAYEGVSQNVELPMINGKIKGLDINAKFLLFIGRLEERKNIIGIIKAFEILKEKYAIPHKLVLAGKFGFGKEKIIRELAGTNWPKDIVMTGFVSEKEKWSLLRKADAFLFPTFYEGFGLPILEAQSVGTPVVASNNSSVSELISGANGASAILVDPMNAEEIAEATQKILNDESFRSCLIERGLENMKRFSWEKCARETSRILLR
jgi:glycosyltransferase involved in cell wall biosynthesis